MHRLKTALLVATIVVLAGLLWMEWSRPRLMVVPDPRRVAPLSEVSAEVNALAQQLAIYREQMDAVQRMAALIIGLSSLYAVVLAVSSYLSLQQVLDQAKDKAKQITDLGKDVKQIEQDLKESAPALVAAQKSLDGVVARLNTLLPPTDVERDEFYGAHLREEERQEILVAERLTAIFGRDTGPAVKIAEMYRGLGRFYNARCASAFRRPDDLERAYYYLLLAVERNASDFCSLNDLGNVLGRLAKQSQPRKAEFNRDCFRALLGKKTGEEAMAEEALEDLQTACKQMTARLAKTIVGDTERKDDCDLEWLTRIRPAETAELRKRAEALIAQSQ